ncbi:MAG TPA: peptidoglycan-binding protein, partial [Clostridiales bacterium]|nr:peptidoglycan-binding protein [Clostridiales bacterium]
MNKRKFSMIMAIAMLLIWFTPTVNAASLLRVGSRGSQVKELQNKLNELGYNCGKADGIFGSRTQKAVKDFQRANGLSVDGIVGPKTLAALYDGKTSSNATSPSKPTSSSNSSASITSTLRRGSRGSQVVALQKRLNELGYNCGKADGIFGANTESAVKKF